VKTHSGFSTHFWLQNCIKNKADEHGISRCRSCVSQSDFGKTDGDHRVFLLSIRLASGRQVGQQKWVMRGRYSLPQVQKQVGHVHRSPTNLTSLKTSFCIFIHRIFVGQRAKPLELHRLFASSRSLLLAIKVSIFWALFDDTPKVPVPSGLDQHLLILHRRGWEEGVNLAEMHKDAAMIINWLVKEEGRFAINGNNSRLHGLLSHNIIKDRIKGREYSKWLAGKTC